MLNAKAVKVTLTLPDGRLKVMAIEADAKIVNAISMRLLMAAMSGEVAAIREVMERVDGKALQRVDMSTAARLEIVEEIVDHAPEVQS